jgi:predicted DNA-binding transcriptional regulator AlpA
MKFLTYEALKLLKGIPYSDRQLRRLEAKGSFPKRVSLAGGALKGWPETVIDEHLEMLADISRQTSGGPR